MGGRGLVGRHVLMVAPQKNCGPYVDKATRDSYVACHTSQFHVRRHSAVGCPRSRPVRLPEAWEDVVRDSTRRRFKAPVLVALFMVLVLVAAACSSGARGPTSRWT